MKTIEPHIVDIAYYTPLTTAPLEELERVARISKKSEGRIEPGTAEKLTKLLLGLGHDAALEFGCDIRVIYRADRGFSHELVRHRVASYMQESTRYCNYTTNKFDGEITCVEQPSIIDDNWFAWERGLRLAEATYRLLISRGVPAEEARSVLPIGLATTIAIKTNIREWRHIFKLRCSKKAHPTIRGLMCETLQRVAEDIPVVFDDLKERYLG